VTFLGLSQAPANLAVLAEPAGATEAVIVIRATVLRDSMPAVLASLAVDAASANATNPSIQNIAADTFNEDSHLGALQEVDPASVKPA
jgi:hypothetical protein